MSTLYELLEVNPQVSQDALRAAYDRLSAKRDAGTLVHPKMDPDTYFKQIQDAFSTLGNPVLRARYDARTNGAEPRVLSEPRVSADATSVGRWLLLLGLLGVGLLYFKAVRDEEQADKALRAAMAIEQEQAAEARRREDEAEDRALARRDEQARLEEERMVAQQRREAELAFRQAESSMQRLDAQRDRERRQDEYASQRARVTVREEELLRLREQQAAQRRLAQDKAALDRIEREQRTRVAVIPRNDEPARRPYTNPYRDERDSTR